MKSVGDVSEGEKGTEGVEGDDPGSKKDSEGAGEGACPGR